ncbi:MAG: DSD1 family PLP-dependent enzyme, partial [Gaiellaceae bacterium]
IRTVSGGSTGLWDLDQGLTELQLGSYVLMEGRYASVGLPFQPALFCAATIISRPRRHVAVLDAGWKSLSGEFGLPLGPPGLSPLSLSDEHLVCEVARESKLEIGSVVLLLPAHLDPTVNLHDRLVAFEGGTCTEWEVDLRRTGPRLFE